MLINLDFASSQEATLAVAAVEKKKRERNGAGTATATAGTKNRNRSSRKLVHSIELRPGRPFNSPGVADTSFLFISLLYKSNVVIESKENVLRK